MLRNVLLVVSLLVACLGVVLCLFLGQPQAFPIALWGGILFVLILLERWRYRHGSVHAAGDWQATDEQFIDPESGKLTRVYYHSRTGDRRYEVVDQ